MLHSFSCTQIESPSLMVQLDFLTCSYYIEFVHSQLSSCSNKCYNMDCSGGPVCHKELREKLPTYCVLMLY